MSATRKPAPSEVGAGVRLCSFNGHAPAVARFILSDGCFGRENDREQFLCMQHVITAEPIGTMQMVEILDENWRDNLLSRWKLSGAPLQPGATQPERGGGQVNQKISDDHLDMWIRKLHEGKNLYHEHQLQAVEELIANRALLTTLLERMARLVVEEATNHLYVQRLIQCSCGANVNGPHGWADHLRSEILSDSRLQQLREAVERP